MAFQMVSSRFRCCSKQRGIRNDLFPKVSTFPPLHYILHSKKPPQLCSDSSFQVLKILRLLLPSRSSITIIKTLWILKQCSNCEVLLLVRENSLWRHFHVFRFYQIGLDLIPFRLRREAKFRPFDPKIKFCIKCHYQGLKNLVFTGDTFPLHPCSLPLPTPESDLLPSPIPSSFLTSKQSRTYSSKGCVSEAGTPLNPHLFDVRRRLYRPIKHMKGFPLHERL